jgi:hypothetical protein
LVAVHSGALADAAGSPAWRRLTSMSEGRPPYFALADSRRDRLLILGMDGWDGLMNAWELPLDGPARLRELPADGALHLQWATAAAYDPAGDRVLFLDSYLPAGVLGVLELSPAPRWTTLATTGELPTVLNYGGAAIVDPIHDALVLFHGVGNLPDEGEVHRLGKGGGAVIVAGVAHIHAGEPADHALVFEQGLQHALARFRLILRIGAVELAAAQHVVDGRGPEVMVGAGAEKREAGVDAEIAPRERLHLPHDFQFR